MIESIDNQAHQLYIDIDEQCRVIKIFSTVFEKPSDESILLAEGYGDEYVHAHLYLKKPIYDFGFNYKYIDGEVVERTDEEKQLDIPAKNSEPTPLELAEQRISSLEQELVVTNLYITDLELLILENL